MLFMRHYTSELDHMSNDMLGIDLIFSAAIELDSAEDRAAYLDQACAGDTQLNRRLEKLLDAHFAAGSFLESPAPELDATCGPPNSEQLGKIVGPYKLLQEIGEGGFGTVFMAEQQEPLR